uniref:Deacetylase sirtuin-type domain-containing protein n=1 Tax=Psilocybe cubensis TaxID=181762 RepID=A0A8H8CIN6_PSICU
MRVSVPGIPQAILDAKPIYSVKSIKEATERLSEFLGIGNVTVLTGAGVSVDSGIRAYRGDDGRYMNPNYKLRSYLGYPPVRDAQPNTTHFALAALQHTSHVSRLITQNVDGLHHKALRKAATTHWDSMRIQENILELHGTLHHVHCNRGHVVDRNTFQDRLSAANPRWYEYAEELERTGMQPRTNPDGDVAVEQLGISYSDFIVPNCPDCLFEGHQNSVLKPEVIFFGESIPKAVKDRSYHDIETCDKLLLMGTTLATYSAFRLLKHALELNKRVMLLNMGPSRADGLPGIVKLDIPSGAVMRDVARNVMSVS